MYLQPNWLVGWFRCAAQYYYEQTNTIPKAKKKQQKQNTHSLKTVAKRAKNKKKERDKVATQLKV